MSSTSSLQVTLFSCLPYMYMIVCINFQACSEDNQMEINAFRQQLFSALTMPEFSTFTKIFRDTLDTHLGTENNQLRIFLKQFDARSMPKYSIMFM